MAHPWVADRGVVLQIWVEAANILNKQLWTADKGWSSAWGWGKGLIAPCSRKKYLVMIYYTGPCTWMGSLKQPRKIHLGEMKNVYAVLVRKPERKRPL
jgi:hypothetical protein